MYVLPHLLTLRTFGCMYVCMYMHLFYTVPPCAMKRCIDLRNQADISVTWRRNRRRNAHGLTTFPFPTIEIGHHSTPSRETVTDRKVQKWTMIDGSTEYFDNYSHRDDCRRHPHSTATTPSGWVDAVAMIRSLTIMHRKPHRQQQQQQYEQGHASRAESVQGNQSITETRRRCGLFFSERTCGDFVRQSRDVNGGVFAGHFGRRTRRRTPSSLVFRCAALHVMSPAAMPQSNGRRDANADDAALHYGFCRCCCWCCCWRCRSRQIRKDTWKSREPLTTNKGAITDAYRYATVSDSRRCALTDVPYNAWRRGDMRRNSIDLRLESWLTFCFELPQFEFRLRSELEV